MVYCPAELEQNVQKRVFIREQNVVLNVSFEAPEENLVSVFTSLAAGSGPLEN